MNEEDIIIIIIIDDGMEERGEDVEGRMKK